MAHSFITDQAGPIASTALAVLQRQIVLGGLVYRDVSRDFGRGVGDTVTIPKPATLTARVYDRTPVGTPPAMPPIVLDEVTETGVPVTIDRHTYSAVGMPDEDDALNLRDFARQVLAPQMTAVAVDIEETVAARFAAHPATDDVTVESAKDIVGAWEFLTNNKVPMAGRYLVMGSAFAGALLRDDLLVRADASGDTTALRQAAFRPLFGFQPYESLYIPADTAYAFTREAVALATVTPRSPRGATSSSLVSEGGVTMRWLSDYDPAFLRDRSIVSILSGTAAVAPERLVRLKLAAAG